MSEIKSGYLEKLGGKFGNSWQKRFFSLERGKLSWYKKEGKINFLGSVDLQYKTVTVDTSTPLIFTIPTDKKEYQMKASSTADYENWIDALHQAGATIETVTKPTVTKRRSLLGGKKKTGHSRKRSVSDPSIFKDIPLNPAVIITPRGSFINNNSNNHNNNENIIPNGCSTPRKASNNNLNYNKIESSSGRSNTIAISQIPSSCPNSINIHNNNNSDNYKININNYNSNNNYNNNSNSFNSNNNINLPHEKMRHATLDDIRTPLPPFSPLIQISLPSVYYIYEDDSQNDYSETENSYHCGVMSDHDSLIETDSSEILQLPRLVEYSESEM